MKKIEEKTAIIIPAYNASQTIICLVNDVLRIVPKGVIYIVEDSSPDGTGKLAKKTFENNPRVKIYIRKEKAGRGSAVLLGIKEGLKDNKTKTFIEMDADYYHNALDLPKLIQKNKLYDVVVASRYIHGSKIIEATTGRRIFSLLSNIWAKVLLGLPVSDYTNGYRAYSRTFAEKLVHHQFKASGFAVLSEILMFAAKNGFSVAEIPTTVTFHKMYGSSFSLKEVKEAFITTLSLRFS